MKNLRENTSGRCCRTRRSARRPFARYDSAGRVAAVTNALGVATVYGYDARGNKAYEGGGTYPVTYAYDAYNVMTNKTTYRAEGSLDGDTTAWEYDEATGLLLAKTYADGNGPSYSYTPNGRLATRTWARRTSDGDALVTTYSYDIAAAQAGLANRASQAERKRVPSWKQPD